MSVMSMNSRMAMAEKLSVQQLQQAIQSGSIPAYIGIPLIEQKTREQSQMAQAQQGQERRPSIAEQVLQQAEQQDQGIDQLPSNLPVAQDEEMGMAGGGIVAFADRGLVEDMDVLERMRIEDPEGYARMMREVPAAPPQYSNYAPTTPRSSESEPSSAPATSPAGDFATNLFSGVRSRLRAAPNQSQRNEMRDLGVKSGIFGVGTASSRAQADKELRERLYGPKRESTPAPRQPDAALDSRMLADSFNEPTPPTGQGSRADTQGAQPGINTLPSAGTAQQPTAQAAKAAEPAQKSALDQYAEMLMKEREGSGKERDKAKAMAILQAGLGIMGGTSPNAFANIAQGVLPATQAYQQEIKGIRREDAARIKELMGLGVSKEKLALEAKKLGISERRFDQMYELEKQKIGIMGGQRSDLAAERSELARERRIDTMFNNIRNTPWAIGRTPAEILRAAQEAVNAGRDVQETPAAPSGITVRRIS
jgi:hypothetical protein